MEHNSIDSCMEEWETLSNEYRSLEKLHNLYQAKLEEVNSLQQKCTKGIAHQRYRLNIIKTSLKRLEKSSVLSDVEEKERNSLLQTDLLRRKAQLYEMENILPKPSGRYLKIILGNINVSILDKNERFRYKDEYEKFKLVMSLIAFGLSVFNCIMNIRTMDLIHMFLLVWYYCTLTIRESILKVNGSRMKGWWRTHHFISTVLAGVMLIWPVGECYNTFRTQFMAFNVYISFVQYLQFMYQKGCLYRLKCLGQSHNMDITVEGFQSWMWKGLGFLLPFLFIGYFWELYHSYVLYQLMTHPTADWHISTLCVLFLILFLGNSITTLAIIPQKLKERLKLKYRFTRLDKYIWTHKRRRVSFRNPDSHERRTPAARAASFSKMLNNAGETTAVKRTQSALPVSPLTVTSSPAPLVKQQTEVTAAETKINQSEQPISEPGVSSCMETASTSSSGSSIGVSEHEQFAGKVDGVSEHEQFAGKVDCVSEHEQFAGKVDGVSEHEQFAGKVEQENIDDNTSVADAVTDAKEKDQPQQSDAKLFSLGDEHESFADDNEAKKDK